MASPPRLLVAAPAPDLVDAVEAAIAVDQPAGTSVSRFPAMPRAMITSVRGTDAVEFHALSTRPVRHVHGRPFEAFGLVLPPQTAARLMGPSTGARVDATLPWTELAGASEATRLVEEIARADCHAARLRALQDSLRRVLARGPERVRRARADSLQRLCATVGLQGPKAAVDLGIGERQLERHCRAMLGMAPKPFHRLVRFHAALAACVARQRLPDAEAALAAGYCDQSHLARESRRLAGVPLRELLSGAREGDAWWALSTRRQAVR